MSIPPRPARLDPVGRARLPRRSTVARGALVAALLLTAAGVLYAAPGEPAARPAPAASPAVPTTWPSTGPAGFPPGTGFPPEVPLDEQPPGAAATARHPIPAGMVGVPVVLGEPAALAVLHPGDRVDLLALPSGGSPSPVADEAAVLAVDRATTAVLLALTPAQAREVMAAPDATRFAVIVRP